MYRILAVIVSAALVIVPVAAEAGTLARLTSWKGGLMNMIAGYLP